MDKSEVVILHGPDFVGKCTFYSRELRKTHEMLQPAKIFMKDSSLGFRDICLQIVKFLKEGKKIAIVDCNECKKTRLSYVNLLQKKCENMSVVIVSILPKYGCEQLFWSREQRLASESTLFEKRDGCQSDLSVNDGELTKWFNKDSDVAIKYRPGIVEKPTESEGCSMSENIVGIYTKSAYKFEVPVIFIQWEVICELEHVSYKMSKLSKALQLWSDINQCGRIIVVCDGLQISTGEQTKMQQQANIDKSICSLINQFTSSPVYVFQVIDRKQAGCYVVPPKPGILAFLQQRHCLNLHSRRSIYMFETSCHIKMAENAGVRHIKASRVIDHPSLLVSSHASVTPPIPEMLKTEKVLPVQYTDRPPFVPLVQFKDSLSEKKILQNLPHGRCEYMYATDLETLQRYNELYIKFATKVGTPGSKMSPKKKCHSTPEKCNTSLISDISADQSKLNVASRDLPKWMIKKDRSQGSSDNNNESESRIQTSGKIRKTIYVMTEKELVEVACDILKQGGKDEIVERFLSENDVGNELYSDIHKMKKKKSETSRNTSEPKKHKMEIEKTDVMNDFGNKLSSVCHKIESDLEADELNSKVDQDIDISTDKIESIGNKREREGRADVGETVSSILDDFTASSIPSKPSPRKRTRIKEEPRSGSSTPFKRTLIEVSKHKTDNSDIKSKQSSKNNRMTRNQSSIGNKVDLCSEFMSKKRKIRQTPDLSHLDDIF